VAQWALNVRSVTPAVRYALSASDAGVPPALNTLLMEGLKDVFAVTGNQHDARLLDIARIMASRISAKTWRQYASVFCQFVRFCLEEHLSFLPADQLAGLLWAQALASKGTVQAATAQPYFSAINTVHELMGFPKPCAEDNFRLQAFRKGWRRLQAASVLGPERSLAFPAHSVFRLYELLPSLFHNPLLLREALFVVLNFLTFLRPDSLLSVAFCQVVQVGSLMILQYKPLNWKGKIVEPAKAKVLQLVLGSKPFLVMALQHYNRYFKDHVDSFWGSPRPTVHHVESWFARVLSSLLQDSSDLHTLYSLRRGGASAARAVGVPLNVLEAFGGWAANSEALRKNYLDYGVPADDAARFFFQPLVLPQVAPFDSQFFNK
jgi:hypothetical protein